MLVVTCLFASDLKKKKEQPNKVRLQETLKPRQKVDCLTALND